MILVDKPVFAPGECLILGTNHGPLIDLLTDFQVKHQGRMYISAIAVQDMAKKVGMVEQSVVDRLEQQVRELKDGLDASQALVAQLEATQDRIVALQRDGFTPRKRAGRPSNAERSAA